MDELDKAIDKFYRAFADIPAPTKIGGCPCCIDDKEIQILLTTPLRELTADDLSAYASSALLTVGSVLDYLYFLPRIMEISIRESWWSNIEVTGRAIASTNLTSWPAQRREELDSFLRTLIGHIVDTGSHWLIDDWFCAICRIELDIHPFLRIVEKNSDAILEYWGANAKCLEVGKLCNAFWELPNKGHDDIVRWFQSDDISRVYAEAYGYRM
jgi:hypothetical protein